MKLLKIWLMMAAPLWVMAAAQGEEIATNAVSGRSKFPCDPDAATHYTAYRVHERIKVNGRLDEKAWEAVPRSTRFVDIITGKPAMYDTRVGVLWDEKNLYVGYWVEEPNVAATLKK